MRKKKRINHEDLEGLEVRELDAGRLGQVTGGETNWWSCDNPDDCRDTTNVIGCTNEDVCLMET